MSTPAEEADERGRYIGALLRVSWQWVRQDIFATMAAAGYQDLKPAHIALFRYPTLDAQRPTVIADELQITKQSVNDLLGQLEALGYLTRTRADGDGRARVVRLTAKGRRLERTMNEAARDAEDRIAELLGPRRFQQLRSALEDLTDLLGDG
jgi:DNA-binding MarR family transcriptional regulator